MSRRFSLGVSSLASLLICLFVPLLAAPTAAPAPTRLLRQPTISATHIAFAYANNIWSVERAGGVARRLTSFQGATVNPKFSPDGRQIAFSAEYSGNVDVYVVAAEGGEPRRLTWHPGGDVVQGWTPDGKSVLFASSRATWAPSGAARFWTVPVEGGVEQPLALPRGYQGKISPDGTRLAYRMNSSWDDERRNYRGGQNRPIWIVDLKTYDLVSPPWTDSKDVDPVWVGDAVYFLSDRDGVANVWSYEARAKRLRQVTKFTDFDVKTIDAGGGAVVFEQAGVIHELDPGSGRDRIVQITATGDFPWMMPRWEDVTSRISNLAISPTGKRALVEARGEIFTIPTEKGDVRNLTHSSASAERDPAWSPDGKYISYFSDKSGEYKLMIEEQDGIAPPREIALAEADALLHAVVVAWIRRSCCSRIRISRSGCSTSRRGRRRSSDRISGWCRNARSTRSGAPTRSGSPTPAGCDRCTTRFSSAMSRPAKRNRSRTILQTRFFRRGTPAGSTCGSWRQPISAWRRSGST